LSGSTRTPFPPRSFADPRGLDPHHPLRPCFMPLPLLGFLPSELLPASKLCQARRLVIPSRCSSGSLLESRFHPQGFSVSWQSVIRIGSVASLSRPLLSWVFIASTALRRVGLASSLDGASAHDLSFGLVLARSRSWSSAFSFPTAWRLPLSRAPAVLAFLAFRAPEQVRRSSVGHGPQRCF